jgi:wobble nucleotide-excising tRNase
MATALTVPCSTACGDKSGYSSGGAMIKTISIRNVATYADDAGILDGLKAINFIYGANGAGKTTISRVLSTPEKHPDCQIDWTVGGKLDCLIYNRDFVEENFKPQLKGIFTLGTKDDEILSQIENLKVKLDEIRGQTRQRERTLKGDDGRSGKEEELARLLRAADDDFWQFKVQYDGDFQDAFKGARNSKVAFRERLLREAEANQSQLLSHDELKERSATVFGKDVEKRPLVPTIHYGELLDCENASILKRRVIGTDEVDIAAMIKRLGNSDWVKEGRRYFDLNHHHCPFCQQKTDTIFAKSLGEYFDEQYSQDLAEIDELAVQHGSSSARLVGQLESILAAQPDHLDVVSLFQLTETVRAKIGRNKQHIGQKRREPSFAVALEPLSADLGTIDALISTANSSIEKHNDIVENLGRERRSLTAEVWKFVVHNAADAIARFNTKKGELEKAIAGLKAGITVKQTEHAQRERELQALERNVTSVQPTVDAINRLLDSFGFRGFRLKTSSAQQNCYEIVRNDGRDASSTLSEGERTFVTFLYFHQLTRGSTSESGISRNRVVGIDDPISSLDSDVLFIVSTLVKRIFAEARDGTGLIKQVFLLTHNIYFHKEVSFDPGRGDGCRNDESFWIVRKRGDTSQIEGFGYNPIKTSYELLWAEVRNHSPSPLTIQNTLRRILENYFKIMGHVDKDAIVAYFQGEEQFICNSLFSWVNEGSHYANDDLYVSCDTSAVEKYLTVFRKIFEKSGHGGHYKMMMRSAQKGTEDAKPMVPVPGPIEIKDTVGAMTQFRQPPFEGIAMPRSPGTNAVAPAFKVTGGGSL